MKFCGILLCTAMLYGHLLLSQRVNSLTAKITFNTGEAIEEISGKKVRTGSVLFVNDRFGNSKSACFLHGSPGSYINIGNDSSVKPLRGTLSLWIKIDVAMQGGRGYQFNPILLAKNNNGEDFNEAYAMAYDFKAHKLVVATSLNENLQVQLYSGDTINIDKWHHLAMTFDDDTLAFYLDGKLNSKIRKNFKSEYLQGDSVLVGSTASKKNERYLCASVDDICIYNSVLREKEIYGLYNQQDPNLFNMYLHWFLLLTTAAAFMAFVIWLFVRNYKRKLKQQELQNRVKARMNELETRAIRMQMNPHFMFNSLNTLQRFILEADIDKAQSYLSMFSRLLRQLIESSDSESISLAEEMRILSAFLEIEKLRFNNSFGYVLVDSVSSPEQVKIPFMLVQPLLENAIWHGLLPKNGEKRLYVSFTRLDSRRLVCKVEDNGVGRNYSAAKRDPLKKRSLALDFIRQRLDILGKMTGVKGELYIHDKTNSAGESEGTLVELIIPILN